MSLRLFQFAMISVACYLVLSLFAALGVVSTEWLGDAMDEIVITAIENWQAFFGGKHVAVPV
ncbi:hypothetical protein SPHINGO361_100068 [Sphingomonas sp. EC-HK361]|uniref:hypothetical protein n=1 Tax=Sphingomonas sp. EC-HK361 TaxID=2038397 RepID=UPI001254180B|nr:hypothetical protein [Sphingomonas sp. EC-HK361]VVS96463.1 hypothetical protein SPHINGO361_100068 [Sphingomonas sp. EC-HK361]